jgi:hypothetical protein
MREDEEYLDSNESIKQRLRNSRVAGKGEQIRQQPWAKKKKKATKRDQRRIKVEK